MNFFAAYLESIAPRLGMTLMHSLWQGALAAIALAIVLRLLATASSAMRYFLCCCAMAGFVLAVAGTFAALGPAQPENALVTEPLDVHQSFAAIPVVPLHVTGEPARSVPAIDPMRWAGYAWLAGAFAAALWNLFGWCWLQRCACGRELDSEAMLAASTRALGIHRTIRLMESVRMSVPAVVGVIRPVILIPLGLLNDLEPAQIEAILIHELAHVRRHDYLVNLLQVMFESLLFYHPAMWWISSQIRREREHCCDDIATSRFTPKTYVSALMALEQRRSPAGNALVAAIGGTLLERARRLLGRASPANMRPVRSGFAALIALACIFVPVIMDGCGKSNSSSTSPSTSAAVQGDVKSTGVLADDMKPDYSVEQIGPGDLLQVSIPDLIKTGVETTKRVRVADPDGTITLPFIPTGIRVAGMTDAEAQRVIAQAYKVNQVISDPTISVLRVEATSTKYCIMGGGVGKPGDYTIFDPQYRLTDALAGADANLQSEKSVLVIRKAGDSKTRTLKISVGELLAGDPQTNIAMRPGDVVILPPSDRPTPGASDRNVDQQTAATDKNVEFRGNYWIGGSSIKRVGVYYLANGVTLKQAIISAGGLDDGYVSVFRREASKDVLILKNAHYSQLVSGAINDIAIHPGDTIMANATAQPWQAPTSQQAVTP